MIKGEKNNEQSIQKALAVTSAVAKATADVAKNVSESSKAYLELSEKKAKIQFLLDDIAVLEAELNFPAKKAEKEPTNSNAPVEGEVVNGDLSEVRDAEVEK